MSEESDNDSFIIFISWKNGWNDPFFKGDDGGFYNFV